MNWRVVVVVVSALIGVSSVGTADNIPVPKIYTVQTLSEQFRGILAQKIQDLSNNYITHIVDNRVEFSSNHEIHCPSNINVQPKRPLAAIQYFFSPTKTGLREQVDYIGCHGKVIFSENIVTEGTDLKPSWSLVLKGKREFELSLNETHRTIRYVVNDGIHEITVMAFDSIRDGDRVITRFFLQEKLVLTMIEASGVSASRLIFELPESFEVHLMFYNSKLNSRWGISPPNRNLQALALPSGQVIYSTGATSETSLEFFQDSANRAIINAVIGTMNSVLDLYLNDMPFTHLVKSGVQVSKFLDDLLFVQFILTTNGPLQQAKNIIIDFITAIKNGNLVVDDRRTHKK
jgi:hypothetical protein